MKLAVYSLIAFAFAVPAVAQNSAPVSSGQTPLGWSTLPYQAAADFDPNSYGLDSEARTQFAQAHKNVLQKEAMITMFGVVGAMSEKEFAKKESPVKRKQMQKNFETAAAAAATAFAHDECNSQLQDLAKATHARGGLSFSAEGDTLAFVKDGKTFIYSDKGLVTVDGGFKGGCNFDHSKKLKDGYDAVFASTLPQQKAPSNLSAADTKAAVESFQAHRSTVQVCREQLDQNFVESLSKDNPLFAAAIAHSSTGHGPQFPTKPTTGAQ